MHKRYTIRAFTLFLALYLLGGCTTTQLKPITEKYTGSPPEKGLVAFRLGYKTIHPENKFIDIPFYIHFNGANASKEKTIRKSFSANSNQFKETTKSDYKIHDFIIELDAGEYSVQPANTMNFTVLKPQSSRFEVKPGYVTYIGQYDIEATVKGKDFTSRKIRKRTSHTRDQKCVNIEEILAQYPNLKYESVLKQPSPPGDYRMRTTLSPNTTAYIHVYKTKK